MAVPSLIYLGHVSSAGEEQLLLEGSPLSIGAEITMVRRRSAWNAKRAVQRIIVGSLDARADLLLTGSGVMPEHVRFYVPVNLVPGQEFDMRPMQDASTWLNGQLLEDLAWIPVRGSEDIRFGPWRFRLETGDVASE